MGAAPTQLEAPRKQPTQARSASTVEAILDGTIQALIRHGKEKLTTTLVAQRAGVSVGTLYQYFPNKQALLHAALRRKIIVVTEGIERACAGVHGKPIPDVVDAIAKGYFKAKMLDPRAGLALYAVSSEGAGMKVTEDLRDRSTRAIETALASSSDRMNAPVPLVAFMLQAAMTGISRRLLETHGAAREQEAIQQQMVMMCRAYAESVTR